MQATYEIISTISFSLSLLFFLLSLFLWLKFDIWRIIGDLSGRTAKKSIERLIASREATSVKKRDSRPIPFSKGRISEAIGNLGANKISEGISKSLGINKAALYTAGTNITEDLQKEVIIDSMETELLTTEEEMDRTPVEIKLIEEIITIHTKDVIE